MLFYVTARNNAAKQDCAFFLKKWAVYNSSSGTSLPFKCCLEHCICSLPIKMIRSEGL
jgi:hypothetical protein